MIKYRVYFGKIEKVEIEKETEKCVWIDGYRCQKGGWSGDIYDTYEDAKNSIIEKLNNEIKSDEEKILWLKKELEKIKQSKEI